MKEIRIYKDNSEAIIIKAIEKNTNKPTTELEQLIGSKPDILRALSEIPSIKKTLLLEHEENIFNAITRRLDYTPWFFNKENGLLFCISAHLAIWIYPDVRKAGYSKQESAAITTSYVETIINDLTMGEWMKIIQKSDTNSDVNYFYVRDNIKKPSITKDEIKAKLQQYLFDVGVNATIADVEKAFEPEYYRHTTIQLDGQDGLMSSLSCFNKSGWGRYEESLYDRVWEFLENDYLWEELYKTNPELANDDKYSDGLMDFGFEIIVEMSHEILDGETIITLEEWKEMLIIAVQKYYAIKSSEVENCTFNEIMEFNTEQERDEWANAEQGREALADMDFLGLDVNDYERIPEGEHFRLIKK